MQRFLDRVPAAEAGGQVVSTTAVHALRLHLHRPDGRLAARVFALRIPRSPCLRPEVAPIPLFSRKEH